MRLPEGYKLAKDVDEHKVLSTMYDLMVDHVCHTSWEMVPQVVTNLMGFSQHTLDLLSAQRRDL